jgi:sulfofructose kinase
MKRIVVLGSAVLDHRVWVDQWPPPRGRTRALDYVEDLGGPAAVAAATIARLGGSAALLALVGGDSAGARVAAMLRAHGVDTRDVIARPGAKTPASSITIVPGGERFIVAYPGEGLSDEPGWASVDALDGAEAVVLDSRMPRTASAFAAAARARHLPVVVDFDVDAPDVWRLARLATHAIADEDLAHRAGGPEALLGRLRAEGVWGAVTLGPGGAVFEGGRAAAFPIAARDTTGAGDVFHGAFALALVAGQRESEALMFASAAAAVRCETGHLPDRRAAEALLAARHAARDS